MVIQQLRITIDPELKLDVVKRILGHASIVAKAPSGEVQFRAVLFAPDKTYRFEPLPIRVRDGTKWSIESDDMDALKMAKIKIWVNGIAGDGI